jgi:uncharacterized protein (TIGR00251 family)
MGLRLALKVAPASGKSCCILDKTQRLKCYVKSPAQDGKANKELIKYFAQIFDVMQSDVEIIAGLTQKNKILLIATDQSYEQFLQKLGAEQQNKIF